MSNKTAIVVDRWVAERVWEFCEHDDVGMVFDGVGGVLVRDDGDSDAPQVPMHVSTLTLKVASQEGNHHLVHVLKRELRTLRPHVEGVEPLGGHPEVLAEPANVRIRVC